MIRKALTSIALSLAIVVPALAMDTQKSDTNSTSTDIYGNSMSDTKYQNMPQGQQETIASSWGLTAQEYKQYLYILNNTADGYSWQDKRLDPNFILAAEANNPTDFKKHVTQLAINEHNRLAKALKVSVAMAIIAKQLYPNEMPVMLGQSRYMTNSLQQGDDIKAFVDIKASQSFTLVSEILKKVQAVRGAHIDLFFVGNPSASEIENFAYKEGIDKNSVGSQIITLNYGDEQYKQFINSDLQQLRASGIKVEIPLVVVMRNGQYLYASF